MKAGSSFGFAFLGLCAIVGCAGLLHAQEWQPVMVTNAPTSVVTTGGITYAEYSWGMMGCEALESFGPLKRHGSDFSFDWDFLMETGVACPDFVYIENATVVLGALAPGAYTL